MAQSYDIAALVIDGTQWWDVLATIDCNYWSVRVPADCHIRTRKGDANTEDDLPAGAMETLTSTLIPQPPPNNTPPTPPAPRYHKGDPVLYIKSQGSAMTVVARFLLTFVFLAVTTRVFAQVVVLPPLAAPVSIANGGTGQTTNTLAFNALAPCAVQGDVLYYNGTNWVCLATSTGFLKTQGAAANPTWAVPNVATDITGTLAIGNGGTGQTSAQAAFDALAPCATQGDVAYYNGTHWVCLGTGISGQVLQTQGVGANPIWRAIPAFFMEFATGGASGFSPSSSTTYYFAIPLTVNPGTSDAGGLTVPIGSTLRRVDFLVSVIGTLASSENSSIFIRQNHATDITVSTTFKWTNAVNSVAATGLSTVLAAGDSLVMKIVTPAWATAPTVCFLQATVYADLP